MVLKEQTVGAVGTTIEVTVDRLAYGGEGVARLDGLVIFVPRTAPGDVVQCTIVERSARFARAHLDDVIQAGTGRSEPECPVYESCGGCQLQHLEEDQQRLAKAAAVRDAFERIGRVALELDISCEPASSPWNYRDRAVLSWRYADGDFVLGYHTVDSPADLVDIDSCPIIDSAANACLESARKGLEQGLEDEHLEQALEGRLAIRVVSNGIAQLGIFANDEGLAKALAESCSRASGVPATWGRWVEGDRPTLAADAPKLTVRTNYRELTLRSGFDSFVQADPQGAESLYDAVIEWLDVDSGDKVIDGYAGIGVITSELARKGARVTAVESHPGAAADLRANTAAFGRQVHVLELPASRVDWTRPQPDAVTVNPPRSGCSAAALRSIDRSSARRIVYVACDPTTLARDVGRLGDRWQLQGLRVFDLFPQTAHMETVALLTRVSA